MDLWADTNGVILDFSRRGKPTDNATIVQVVALNDSSMQSGLQ
jgi:hypothetical protein